MKYNITEIIGFSILGVCLLIILYILVFGMYLAYPSFKQVTMQMLGL